MNMQPHQCFWILTSADTLLSYSYVVVIELLEETTMGLMFTLLTSDTLNLKLCQ